MNKKRLSTVGALFFGILTAGEAKDPITYREIAFRIQHGDSQQEIANETAARRLLQPLSLDEQDALKELQIHPVLLQFLRDPTVLASPEAVATYNARLEQQKAQAQSVLAQEKVTAQNEDPKVQPAPEPKDRVESDNGTSEHSVRGRPILKRKTPFLRNLIDTQKAAVPLLLGGGTSAPGGASFTTTQKPPTPSPPPHPVVPGGGTSGGGGGPFKDSGASVGTGESQKMGGITPANQPTVTSSPLVGTQRANALSPAKAK